MLYEVTMTLLMSDAKHNALIVKSIVQNYACSYETRGQLHGCYSNLKWYLCCVSFGSESRICEFPSGKFHPCEVGSHNYDWESVASRQHTEFPSWKNGGLHVSWKARYLNLSLLLYLVTTGKQHFTWLSLSLRFNGHFPGEPGLAGVYWSKGWWWWWWQLDYWSYKSCKAPVKSSPPTNQHPVFALDAFSVRA